MNAGSTISFSGALTSPTGSIVLNAADNITATQPVSVGTFTLQNGVWSQDAATLPNNMLPSFSATDFRVSGGTFLRVVSGDGSANPYQISDIYGLQGVASPGLLGKTFELVSDIDASATSTWWGGQGFSPIGNGSVTWSEGGKTVGDTGTAFSGTFNGQGFTVDNLFINRSSQTDVGLFGSNSGTIENLGVVGGTITGFGNVGGVAGNNLSGGRTRIPTPR